MHSQDKFTQKISLLSTELCSIATLEQKGQLRIYKSQGEPRTNNASRYHLFWLSEYPHSSFMLGVFYNTESLALYRKRFIDQPQTSPRLALDEETAQQLKDGKLPVDLPFFTGVFGTAFSGYVIKLDEESNGHLERPLLMLFYTADYRSELLGVFDEVEALERLTAHYDARRQRCMLC